MKRRRSVTYAGNNGRGRIKIAPNAHPLVRLFFAAMNEQQTTFAELAGRTHVGIDTMRFWQRRHMPRLDLFEAALNALDLELCIRRRKNPRILNTRARVLAPHAGIRDQPDHRTSVSKNGLSPDA